MDEDSPIKDFYPEEFEADLNGKMQEWEAVVLIPFIDEVSQGREMLGRSNQTGMSLSNKVVFINLRALHDLKSLSS